MSFVYNLLKFCLRCLYSKNPNEYLNSLFSLKTSVYKTRSWGKLTYSPPFCKNKTKLYSLFNGGSKLLNMLSGSNRLSNNIGEITKNDEIFFVHKVKDNYILSKWVST